MGAIAAYYGGIWDTIISVRLADIFLAFPYTLVRHRDAAVIGPGIQNVFIAIGILGWPSIARVFRSAILTVKENDYVDAARSWARRTSASSRVTSSRTPSRQSSSTLPGEIGGAILTESALPTWAWASFRPTPGKPSSSLARPT